MRITGLLLLWLATTPAFSADKFPFIQTFNRLDTTEKKLEHLRSWHPGLAKENGMSRIDGRHFESLLDLFPFHHVDDEGVLDCSALHSDLELSMPRRYELSHSSLGHNSAYAMFNVVVDELCPENTTSSVAISYLLELSERDPLRALEIMDRIVELHENHDSKAPVEFLFTYAEVAFSANFYEAALESVQKYLAAADSDHGNYRKALKFREAIQMKMRKQP